MVKIRIRTAVVKKTHRVNMNELHLVTDVSEGSRFTFPRFKSSLFLCAYFCMHVCMCVVNLG